MKQTVKVELTNPDRVYWPRDGFTKQQLVDYYAAVAKPMIAALDGRPLSLQRWPKGIDGESWYQQHLGKEAPAWATIVETPAAKRTVRHLVADRPETLRWLGQMGVLTVHTWSSRVPHLEHPDWIVFDLDPAGGDFAQAIEAALIVRGMLDALELPSHPKTSGARGIHVLVPLAPKQSHDDATEFAVAIAATITAKIPWITTERTVSKRKGRLYFDCFQNGYGKTIVAPYSPRGRDGAPVSAPLEWAEVTKTLDPSRFTIATMPRRLDDAGDLFAPMHDKTREEGVKIPRQR
jgi:bifunctional non-homologous end joining protein LigD